jgi:NAD+ kinase
MKRIVVAIKRSKWERDLMRYISPEAVRHLYQLQNDAFDRIYASHLRQQQSLNIIKSILKDAAYAFREDLTHLDFKQFHTIIALGGDNHFIHISHYAHEHNMIGINSDLDTSVGALLPFTTDSFVKKTGDQPLSPERYITEQWTRIGGELIYPDGRRYQIVPCTSEISVRNSYPDTMSRYLIRSGEEEQWEEQKSSGLLLACGVGSTGWYKNCLSKPDSVFPKDAPFFRYTAREVSTRRSLRFQNQTVKEGEILEIISEMEGEISVDANPDRTYDFPPGCRAQFYLSKDRLKVVTDIK